METYSKTETFSECFGKMNVLEWWCWVGNIEYVRLLLDTFPNIDIHRNDDFVFRWACSSGHLDLAKMLLGRFPNINPKVKNGSAFLSACFKGHLDVVKWLSTLYSFSEMCPEGREKIYTNHILKKTKEHGHLDVAEWLEKFYLPK